MLQLVDLSGLDEAVDSLVVGVKQTRHGVDVKLVDQLKITDLLARHFGLTRETIVHDATVGYAEALEAGRFRALRRARHTPEVIGA